MKKFLFAGVGFVILIILIFLFINLNKSNTNENVKLNVGEVTHSPFYAPLYVAIRNGYFEEEGIDISLTMISGANNVTSAVLSGDIDIGFCGPEATIYVYNGGEKDYIQSFAGMTKRDGQFILSREEITDFKWEMLEGKEVLAGRKGGMPLLNFENAVKNAKLDISKVNVNSSVDFASLSSAFISGDGDFVNLFEPNATKLEKLGYGYIVASVGELSGEMPYTAFNARKSYIEKNSNVIKGFTNAIAKGLDYTKNNSAKTIAELIIDDFPDTSKSDLITIIDRYKDADSWLETPYISETMFENLEDIIIASGELDKYVPFENLVDNAYNE